MNKEQIYLETAIRLDDIVKNLEIGKHWTNDETQIQEIISACMEKINYLTDDLLPNGELLANEISKDYQVKFEEIRDNTDLDLLEKNYVKSKNEFGFARIRKEIQTKSVDAWLFERSNAESNDFDRWVAVLNLTETEDRAYWNKFHELAHRLAEPPQKILPFRRESITKTDPVEKLIDTIAGNLAFHPKLFSPHIKRISNSAITFDNVDLVRNSFAPSASLLATTNAVVKIYNRPALAFKAALNKKMNGDANSLALRVSPQAHNILAREAGLILFRNMRVPLESCVYQTFLTGQSCIASENTKIWTTSSGHSLPNYNVTISAIKLNDIIYGVMTI